MRLEFCGILPENIGVYQSSFPEMLPFTSSTPYNFAACGAVRADLVEIRRRVSDRAGLAELDPELEAGEE